MRFMVVFEIPKLKIKSLVKQPSKERKLKSIFYVAGNPANKGIKK